MAVIERSVTRWGVQWRQRNRLDGAVEFLLHQRGIPILFSTRQRARDWIVQEYGYLKDEPDLRHEPHGWRMPRAVRVRIVVESETP